MRTNETITPLREWNDINVKVKYFVSNGDMRTLEEVDASSAGLPIAWIHSKVRMDLLEFTEVSEEDNKSVRFAVCRIFINDTFLGGLAEFEEEDESTIKCSIIIERID